MTRRGFAPYGPSGEDVEALSRVMAEAAELRRAADRHRCAPLPEPQGTAHDAPTGRRARRRNTRVHPPGRPRPARGPAHEPAQAAAQLHLDRSPREPLRRALGHAPSRPCRLAHDHGRLRTAQQYVERQHGEAFDDLVRQARERLYNTVEESEPEIQEEEESVEESLLEDLVDEWRDERDGR
jgi:hypothetical protein